MSDYLNNLVMRSLNLGAVVQPRVPQLFEQAPLPATSLQPETVPEVSEQLSEVPRAAHRDPVARMLRDEPEARHSAEIDGPTPATSWPASVTAPAKDVAPASLIPSAALMKAPSLESPVPTSQPRVQSLSGPEESAAATIGPVWPESYTTTPDQNPRSTLYAPIQSHTSRGTSPGFAQHLRAEPQPLPIKISIGRVDVRAIMPASPAKPATSGRAKPALSLDHYLKQREEGKR